MKGLSLDPLSFLVAKEMPMHECDGVLMGLETTKVEKNVKEDIELNISVISNVR